MTSFANNSRSQLSDANTISDHHKAKADINYRLNFERFSEHLVDVSLNFTAVNDAPQLWMPAWIPGSYLMREFARNITAVHYKVLDSQVLDSQVLDSKALDSQIMMMIIILRFIARTK
ncbi:hypothetical protein [Psychrobacter sp. JCM 18903]|uniref:M61 family metallopeptidase n=1 Tax=Psychrobacter sp. JCM 18903 TaxID=1298610 RepID=UPI00243574C5|nr:hypothetical protein [Psychrobacter sp. JCM 18903]